MANRRTILHIALKCNHNPSKHQNVAGMRLRDGTYLSRLTVCYPADLAKALAGIISQHLTRNSQVVAFDDWKKLLPEHPTPSGQSHRLEDGGGFGNTAYWFKPQAHDCLAKLRAKWIDRLVSSRLIQPILASLQSGTKAAPLSPTQVDIFLDDLRDVFGISPDEWPRVCNISLCQPFRLQVWKLLLSAMQDNDIEMFDMLDTGVPLGVDHTIKPSVLWPTNDHTATDDDDDPLLQCTSSRKSALDHPHMVEPLLQAEIEEVFLVIIPGGIHLIQGSLATQLGNLAIRDKELNDARNFCCGYGTPYGLQEGLHCAVRGCF